MSENKQCFLRPVNNEINKIILQDMSELCLGRSPITGITDITCSRNQVSVLANYKTNQVTIRHLGGNPSTANGKVLKNQTHVLNHGEILEMISGKYFYKVEFVPPPDTNSNKCLLSDTRNLKPKVKSPLNIKSDFTEKSEQGQCSKENKTDSDKRHLSDTNDFNPSVKRTRNTENDLTEKSVYGQFSKENKSESTTNCDISMNKNNTSVGDNESRRTMGDQNKQVSPSQHSQWEDVDNGTLLIYTSAGVQDSSKIAAYDLDGTLILTKSGKVFPKDINDWQIIGYSPVKEKLKSLIAEGFKVVIFTNQGGIGRGNTRPADFKQKIEKIIKELNIPVQVFIATTQNIYRKPAPGMWRVLSEKKNSDIKIDVKKSFYVGDGAGRVANWEPTRKKDFSCSDRLFALNLGLPFYTPEEHFLKRSPAKYALPDFNPADIDETEPAINSSLYKTTQEVIILVGYPGAGKTFFTKRFFIPAGYEYVNRDYLGSWQRCLLLMESALKKNRSVVIDNTNLDKESRSRYISKAQSMNVKCRCFFMTTSFERAKHNNKFREFTDKTHKPVNDIVMNSFKAKMQHPSLDEGFEEIVRVNFKPTFEDRELRKLYNMYLT